MHDATVEEIGALLGATSPGALAVPVAPVATTTTIATATIGHRHAEGVDWPITLTLTRWAKNNKRPLWTLSVVCRGIASESWGYSRKADALAAFDRAR